MQLVSKISNLITNHQRHRQTDGQTDTCDRKTALCTKVSALRGKKLGLHYKPEAEVTCSDRKRGASIKSFTRSKIYKAGKNYNLDLTACVCRPLILNLQPREGAGRSDSV